MDSETFENIWDVLKEAAKIGDGLKMEEAYEGLQSGLFRLWVYGGSAALTAEEGSTLRIGLAAGDMGDMFVIEERIINYARDNGFTSVEIVGRPGWERVLTGYDRVAVVLRKTI